MNNSLSQLNKHGTKLISEGKLNDALSLIKKFVEKVALDPLSMGRVFGSADLDELCQLIGKKVWQSEGSFFQNEGSFIETSENALSEKIKESAIYLVTQLYLQGGHTSVIEDFIAAQSTAKHIIIINDILVTPNRKEIEKRFLAGNVQLIWVPEGSLLDRVYWLQKCIQQFQPARLFLFNHPQDSVIISAVQPGISAEIFFYHHADYYLSLGVCLDYTIHVDIHNVGFFNCRKQFGLKNNIYLPLVSKDLGARSNNSEFLADGILRTCSSGTQNKFASPYLYQYEKLVPEILLVTKGIHVHIGVLNEAILDSIYKGLDEHGIQRENFKLIPWAKSIWQAIIDEKIDLYISSFPVCGGKTSVEVMGSGTPIIVHDNYKSQLLGGKYLIYPEALSWRRPEQLLKSLSEINKTFLQDQGFLSRKHYEVYHLPHIFKEKLHSENKGMKPLPVESFESDNTLAYFELCEVFENKTQVLYEEIERLQKFHSAVKSHFLWRIFSPLRFAVKKIQYILNKSNIPA